MVEHALRCNALWNLVTHLAHRDAYQCVCLVDVTRPLKGNTKMYSSDVAMLQLLLDIVRVDLGHLFCCPKEESCLLHTYKFFNLVKTYSGWRLSCHLASSTPSRVMTPH